MKAKDRAKQIAVEFGASLVDTGEPVKREPNTVTMGGSHKISGGEIRAEAPHGFRWQEGVHEIVEQYGPPNLGTRKRAYESAIERMNLGIELCPLDCEWCYEE